MIKTLDERTEAMRATLLLLATLCGCGDDDNQAPEEAEALWKRIHAENYRAFARAPGYDQRQPTTAPHGSTVDIYVNAVVQGVLDKGQAVSAWPVGSLIVKDGFDGGGALEIVAVMDKRDDGWFWAEYDASGEALFSGRPDTCTGCHGSGADFVRAFGFPK
jgi:hypothetical protein